MKSLSLEIRKTKSELVNIINNSGLHADILTFILKDLLSEAQLQAEVIYRNDLEKAKNEQGESSDECDVVE